MKIEKTGEEMGVGRIRLGSLGGSERKSYCVNEELTFL